MRTRSHPLVGGSLKTEAGIAHVGFMINYWYLYPDSEVLEFILLEFIPIPTRHHEVRIQYCVFIGSWFTYFYF